MQTRKHSALADLRFELFLEVLLQVRRQLAGLDLPQQRRNARHRHFVAAARIAIGFHHRNTGFVIAQ